MVVKVSSIRRSEDSNRELGTAQPLQAGDKASAREGFSARPGLSVRRPRTTAPGCEGAHCQWPRDTVLKDPTAMPTPRRFGALTLFTAVVLAAGARPAAGKLCPYGRFTLTPKNLPAVAMVLQLDGNGATLEGHCAVTPLRPRSYPDGVQLRMRARWGAPCGPGRLVAMRARFDPPCDTLVGVLRARGGAKTHFTAIRIPE